MIIRYKGGFGNELFQYAFSKMLETKYGIKDIQGDFQYYKKLQLNIPALSKLNVKIETADKNRIREVCLMNHEFVPHHLAYRASIFAEKMFNKRYYLEKTRSFIDPLLLLDYEYLDGYWQSWKYSIGMDEILRKDFSRIDQLTEDVSTAVSFVKGCESVFIGIRRGDYITKKRERLHYYLCDEMYYRKAITTVQNLVKNPVFFIFSNDIEWVKKNINFGSEVYYLSDQFSLTDLDEFTVMSNCKHAVIPNSTFHWWAAWLIDNPNKVVVRPPLFFSDGSSSDIFPPNWVSIKL